MAPFWSSLKERPKASDDLEHTAPGPRRFFKKGEPMDGSLKWVGNQTLSHANFAGLLNSSILLETKLERNLAQEVTGKSLRKFGASAWDAFEFEADIKNSLGNWQGVP